VDLFTRAELASYLQIPEVDNATADLLLALVTAEIRAHVGGVTYDALSDLDLLAFKGIALEVAKRCYLNPSGVRQQSSAIDDYQESLTYASETFGGVVLSDSEIARIDKILGRASGAFTVRAVAEPFRSPRRHRIWPEDCVTRVI
jgi:hypothetical protein